MEIVTPSSYQNSTVRKRPRRGDRPCDRCRQRKTRCIAKDKDQNGHVLTCVHCDLGGSTCTFRQGAVRRRQSQADGRAHSLVGREAAQSPSESREQMDSNALVLNTTPGTIQSSTHQTESPSRDSHLHDAGNKSQTPFLNTPAAGGHSSSAFPLLGFDRGRFAELYGLGSDMEPILMRHRPYHPQTREYHLKTHAIRQVLESDQGQQYPLTFHLASDEKATGHELVSSETESIEQLIRPDGPRLVQLFWKNVHPCYPLLHKQSFVDCYERSYTEIPPQLLGSVYLSALRWWSYDPELSIKAPPDSAALRQLVLKTVQNSYHRPKLSSIQAILLLLQCQPEDPLNPDHTFDWGLTCQAVAIAQCMGLHLDCSQWSIPPIEKNVRKRLGWALYMQDRWTAVAYGRPVHIHDDDWTIADIADVDFSDCVLAPFKENEYERNSINATGKQQFIHMIRLAKILSTIISTFYTARGSGLQDTVLLYQQAIPIFDALEAWTRDIPASLGMNVTYQRRLSFHGYLHFSYYGVAINILRRLIRSTAMQPPCYDHQVLSDIRQRALPVAQGAISLVSELRPDHLEAFWYFTSPYLFSLLGSFVTLLLVTSLSSQERSFWQETLNSYLWKLRTMSKSSEPMQYAANRLEGAILRGLEHALAVNLVEHYDDTVSPAMANNGNDVLEFMDFGDWDLFASNNGPFDLLATMENPRADFMPD